MSDGQRLPKYVVFQKKRGETPLQTICAWRELNPQWQDVPASYAGRLDPMAEGKLLVLLGDECKKQQSYTKLDKEYVIEVVLDLGTDSGDVLGFPKYTGSKTGTDSLAATLRTELGTHERAYPAFSSKTVNGKPLFLYTLEGTLDRIKIPTHMETIYRIKMQRCAELSRDELKQRIDSALAIVPRSDEPSKALGADFRQDAVREQWQKIFSEIPDRKFTILTLRITCGSGAYMRTFAERIGAGLGTRAFALSINRTKIGKYQQIGHFGAWAKRF